MGPAIQATAVSADPVFPRAVTSTRLHNWQYTGEKNKKKRGKRKSAPRHEQHHLIASNKDLSLINLVYILINFGAFINKIFVSGSSLAELKAGFVIHNC